MTWKYDKDKQVWMVTIEDGCIRHACYEAHRRGKNWVATVTKNLKAPGGLERRFWRKGSSINYIIPTGLSIGDYIEFGGDYYSSSGRPARNREYYYVQAIGNEAVWLKTVDKKDVGKKAAEPDITLKGKRLIDLGNSGEPLQEGET
jgi:hypothetical protein